MQLTASVDIKLRTD